MMKTHKSHIDGSSRNRTKKKWTTGERVESTTAKRATTNLGLRLLSLQEEVQQRIASDLHDSTCQHLIAASLNVMRMRRSISEGGDTDKICDDVDASIDQALREIRAFTYLLHPQNRIQEGLKNAVEQFVTGFSARTSLECSLEVATEVDEFSFAAQHSVLRIVQEALMNVFRHAKATRVRIAIGTTDTHLKLLIGDNGCGIPIGQPRSGVKAISFGVGIPAMRTRVQQLGGTLEIRSSSSAAAKCAGTTLCVVIPRPLSRKGSRLSERRQSHPYYREPDRKPDAKEY
jgi:two-component system, NarL family, sensor kinase